MSVPDMIELNSYFIHFFQEGPSYKPWAGKILDEFGNVINERNDQLTGVADSSDGSENEDLVIETVVSKLIDEDDRSDHEEINEATNALVSNDKVTIS
jgi:hypothetical protein